MFAMSKENPWFDEPKSSFVDITYRSHWMKVGGYLMPQQDVLDEWYEVQHPKWPGRKLTIPAEIWRRMTE